MRPENLPPKIFLGAYSFIVYPAMVLGIFLGAFCVVIPLTYTSIPIEFIMTGGVLAGVLLGAYLGAYFGVTIFVLCFHDRMDQGQLIGLLRYELRRFPFLASSIISTLLRFNLKKKIQPEPPAP